MGKAQNPAIIAVPDSQYAAAITCQRMGTMLMDDMLVYEVLPASKVKNMLELAKKMNESDQSLKPG